MRCPGNYDGEQVARLPRPHRLLLNFIKSLQPVLAILRGMLQKKKRRGGHVVRDVAEMPFAALPNWAEVRGLFSWVITFTRTQLIKLHSNRRGQPARGSLGKNSHAAVIMRIGARRRPRVVG